jgi:hypothetical protein
LLHVSEHVLRLRGTPTLKGGHHDWQPERCHEREPDAAGEGCGRAQLGGINDEFPFLLGHEAAGVVESVGPDVTLVAPGDLVLNWRRCAASAGRASAASRGTA